MCTAASIRLVVASSLIVGCLVAADAAGAAAKAPKPAAPAKDNAATYYNQAFALLPKDGVNDPEFKRLDAPDQQAPDAPATVALLRKYQKAIDLFHKGAALRRCDWGLKRLDQRDWLTALPHLNHARTVARLVGARMALAVHQKRHAEAFQDAADLLAFSRHIGGDAPVSRLVACGVAQTGIQNAAPGLADAPPAALKAFAARLESLPPAPSAADALEAERDMSVAALERLHQSDAEAPFKPGGVFHEMFQGDDDVLPPLRELWRDVPRRERAVGEVRSLLDEAVEHLRAPMGELHRREAQWQQKRSASDYLATLLIMERIAPLREQVAREETHFAMFRAATAYRLNGKAGLAKHPDPYGKGPFTLRTFAGGFELIGQLKFRGDSVTLTAGRAPQTTDGEAGLD